MSESYRIFTDTRPSGADFGPFKWPLTAIASAYHDSRSVDVLGVYLQPYLAEPVPDAERLLEAVQLERKAAEPVPESFRLIEIPTGHANVSALLDALKPLLEGVEKTLDQLESTADVSVIGGRPLLLILKALQPFTDDANRFLSIRLNHIDEEGCIGCIDELNELIDIEERFADVLCCPDTIESLNRLRELTKSLAVARREDSGSQTSDLRELQDGRYHRFDDSWPPDML